jgi:hypothetical protein
MMEAKRTAHQPTKQEQEENYATARCKPLLSMSPFSNAHATTIVYRPKHQAQSDADALEDARREAMGLPPLQRYRRERVENATDDQVYERFKKR